MKKTVRLLALITISASVAGCETVYIPDTGSYYYDSSDVSVVTTNSYDTFYPYDVNFIYSTYPVYSYPYYRSYHYPYYWNNGIYYHHWNGYYGGVHNRWHH